MNRRFGGRDSAAEVIEYVADVRARAPELGQKIDPNPAERLMRSILANDAHAPDIDARMRGRIFIFFLAAIISDAQYDDDQLEALLTVARKAADDVLEHGSAAAWK